MHNRHFLYCIILWTAFFWKRFKCHATQIVNSKMVSDLLNSAIMIIRCRRHLASAMPMLVDEIKIWRSKCGEWDCQRGCRNTFFFPLIIFVPPPSHSLSPRFPFSLTDLMLQSFEKFRKIALIQFYPFSLQFRMFYATQIEAWVSSVSWSLPYNWSSKQLGKNHVEMLYRRLGLLGFSFHCQDGRISFPYCYDTNSKTNRILHSAVRRIAFRKAFKLSTLSYNTCLTRQ